MFLKRADVRRAARRHVIPVHRHSRSARLAGNVGSRYLDRDFEKAENSDFRSDALCFFAPDAPDYLPVLTNWMQSPWFLKLRGKLNLCHPPSLH